jgi:EAL domain-containing protein (putative c-di-GMP-specific phosphodiesterase class I)
VLRQACAQAVRWSGLPGFRTWVNVSPQQMQAPGLSDLVLRHLEAAGVPPSRLGIEVTESALADETHAAHELAVLSTAGVAIAIDDFGTGYSSLARLNTLPIDVLKIDKSFVRRLDTARGRAAVDAIIKLAHALGMTTVAEGIETAEELRALQALDSDQLSGYLLARPAPAAGLALSGIPSRSRGTPDRAVVTAPATASPLGS